MKRLMAVPCALALILCAALAAMEGLDMGRMWKGSAACSIGPLTAPELSAVEALRPELGWTAYAQSASQAIGNDRLTSRQADAAVLRFAGAPERIAFLPLVSGRLPKDGERGACALDVATAFALFGSVNPEGEWVSLGGEAVQVVGVVEVERPLLLTPAGKKDSLDRLVADDREALEALASALGAQIDPFELSGTEATNLIWLLCGAPWILLAAAAFGALRRRGEPWKTILGALAWMLALGALLVLMRSVPVRLLPARWSDFAFYGEQVAAWNARPYRAADVRDWGIRADAWRVGLWCLGACAAVVVGRRVRSSPFPSKERNGEGLASCVATVSERKGLK
ncbi:hypothetical protein ACH6CV_00175 [Bacillota bacterium Meth-B3]|nr:hypothetical protein [Christensenellaceae bacterium]